MHTIAYRFLFVGLTICLSHLKLQLLIGIRKQVTLAKKKQDHSSKKLSRLNRRRMLGIMAEEARKGIRENFRNAVSICIAVDDSDGRKLIRARCDTPSAPYKFNCVMGISTKKLGSRESVSKEVTEDHAQLTHNNLQDFHRRFFTKGAKRINWGHRDKRPPSSAQVRAGRPVATGSVRSRDTQKETLPGASPEARGRKRKELPEPTLDEKAREDYRRKVRVLASDGGPAERRALFMSATSSEFPNVNFVIKDMIHCIRIATAKPLHLVAGTEEVFNEIIDKRHALLPDLTYSLKWKSILEAVQKEVLQIPMLNLRGAMQYVLKHFAFAKQRMDSTADPLAKVCLMLLPIAVLLAMVSSDDRNQPDQRQRATALLKKFQPKFNLSMGVSADWGLIAINFLRLFDDGHHDISNSLDELEEFTEIFESVFVKGGVFHTTPHAPASGDAEAEAEFMTERVRKQSRKKCVFRCGEKHVVVWGPIEKSDLAALSLETRVAAQTTLERIHADMAGIRLDWSCFSFKRIAVALGPDAARGAAMRGKLMSAIKNLGRVFGADGRMLLLEFEDAMPVMLKAFQQTSPGGPRSGKSFPNLSIWENLLDDTFVERQFPARVGPFTQINLMVRIWHSILDGESTVERDFAHVRTFVRSSKISNESLIEDMVVLKLSGPEHGHSVAFQSAQGDWIPTDFTLRCVEQWRYLYGARCGISAKQRKPRPKPPTRKKTFISVKRSVMKAAHGITQKMKAQEKPMCIKTPYGVDSTFFCSARGDRKEKTSVWNKKLQKFSDLTKRKLSFNERGRSGRWAMPRFKAIHGCKKPTAFPVMYRIAFMSSYNAAAGGAVSKERYTEMGYAIVEGVHRCRFASILIIDSLQRLHGACPTQDWVICAIYMVAKGIPVTTTACGQSRGGDVRKLPLSNIIQHIPVNTRNVEFTFSVEFSRQHRDAVEAVRNCSQDKGSEWEIFDAKKKKKKTTARAAAPARGGANGSGVGSAACGADQEVHASGGGDAPVKKARANVNARVCCEVNSLADLWLFLQQLRRLRNDRAAPVVWIDDRAGM